MTTNCFVILLLIVALLSGCSPAPITPSTEMVPSKPVAIKLPEPRLKSEVSVEEALLKRRSAREYDNVPLTLVEAGQLLWAAQGITSEWGGRTAPSAGGLYPLEMYVSAGNVEGLDIGVYKYQPEGHELVKVGDKDVRPELSQAALNQAWVREAAIDIVIAAVYERTTQKYGERGVRYVHLEAGHAAQNICLQATALNLGAVTIGAFDDEQLKNILSMPGDETPLYLIPVGRKAQA